MVYIGNHIDTICVVVINNFNCCYYYYYYIFIIIYSDKNIKQNTTMISEEVERRSSLSQSHTLKTMMVVSKMFTARHRKNDILCNYNEIKIRLDVKLIHC